MKTTKKQLEKALELACKYVAEETGSCPYDREDDDSCCPTSCDLGIEEYCWKSHFIAQAKED